MFNITPRLLTYFKGFCSSAEIILLFVYMKCRFSLSYRDLEEMMHIRGAKIDHATLQRWVVKFVPLIDQEVRKRKCPVGNSWRMDETYVKLNGKWIYLYRAVDRYLDVVNPSPLGKAATKLLFDISMPIYFILLELYTKLTHLINYGRLHGL